MGRLYCLMGKSSTGKDTVFKNLLERDDLHLIKIVPYTTRPIRTKEVDGEEYHFVSVDEKDRLFEAGKIIEIRKYETIHGPWFYFTVDDGAIDFDSKDYIVIGTLESYTKLRDYYGREHVEPLYIEVDDGLRLERALKRERKQEAPKYEEMCRRFLADQADFAKEKLAEAEINNIFVNNESLDDTCESIAEFIKSR